MNKIFHFRGGFRQIRLKERFSLKREKFPTKTEKTSGGFRELVKNVARNEKRVYLKLLKKVGVQSRNIKESPDK